MRFGLGHSLANVRRAASDGYSYLTGEQAARTALSFEDTDAYPIRQALLTNADMATDLRADGKTIIDHSTTGDDRAMQPGRCHLYDGINDYATLGARLTSGTMPELTVTAWVKNPAAATRIIASEYSASPNLSWYFGVNSSGTLLARLSVDGTAVTVHSSAGTVNDGNWHHIALRFDGGVLRMFIDGVEETPSGTPPSTLYNTATSFYLCSQSGGAAPFGGSVKGAGIWQTALTNDEITALATPETAHVIPQLGSCLFFSHCEGNDPTRVWDASGNGNHLTPSGITAATWLAEDADAPYSAADEVGWSDGLHITTDMSGGVAYDDTLTFVSPIAVASDGVQHFYLNSAVVVGVIGLQVEESPDTVATYQEIDIGVQIQTSTIMRVWTNNSFTDHAYTWSQGDIISFVRDGTDVHVQANGTTITTKTVSSANMYAVASMTQNVSISFTVLGSGHGSGWIGSNLVTDILCLPRDESDTTNDVLGNALDYTGRVPFDGTLIGSPCITLDGTNDYVACGSVGSVTSVSLRVRQLVDDQQLFALANTTATAVTVVAGVLTFGGSLSASAITVDGVSKTASEAGALLNDNEWHLLAFSLASVSATDLRLGTDGTDFGNISLCDFRLNGGSLVYLPCSEQYGGTLYDISGNGNDGTLNGHTVADVWANTQDDYHHAYMYGGTIYDDDATGLVYIIVPDKTDGTAPTHSAPSGYTLVTTTDGSVLVVGLQTQLLRSGGIDSVEATRQGWDVSTGFAGGDGQETSPNYHDGEAAGPFKEFVSFQA